MLSELAELLETRVTSLRLTPLLLTVAAATRVSQERFWRGQEGVAVADQSRDDADTTTGGSDRNSQQNMLQVVRLLLQYGARPHARDVMGRTAVHYGAGRNATDMTLAAVSMCTQATKSAHLLGQEVEICHLSDGMNGKRGIVHGYVAETGCRIVYLFGQRTQMTIKPKHLKVVKPTMTPNLGKEYQAPERLPHLVDMQDRLGNVPLVELVDSNRADAATFLIHRLNASVDIKNWQGDSPASLAMIQGLSVATTVAHVISEVVLKRARNQRRESEKHCVECGKEGTKKQPLIVCQPW
jgi:hypothetical protein